MQLVDHQPQEGAINLDEIVPLTDDEISQALSTIKSFDPLLPAVVIKVEDKSVDVQLADGTVHTILWDGLSWAREYINDDKQGAAPKAATDILFYGDVVYVVNHQQQYRLSQLPEASSALVSLSPDNGEIKAVAVSYTHLTLPTKRIV